MMNPAWNKVLRSCADPERTAHFFTLLSETAAGKDAKTWSDERCRVMAALFSGSEALSNWLLGHPEWLRELEPDSLRFGRRKRGLDQELRRLLQPLQDSKDYSGGFARVREFNQQQLLRIGTRDLAGFGTVPEITQELSDLADVCLAACWRFCGDQLEGRYGKPWHQDPEGRWQPTVGCVLGLGKLGGQELNYSSDVDLMFVYSEEGQVFRTPPVPMTPAAARKPGRKAAAFAERPTLGNHQFFNRLAEMFVAEVLKMTARGSLYRVDLRLRPEGESGPFSRSLSSYENYYAQWGQTWERMMLIKARGVAGDDTLAAEFLEMVQPFRYPRSINESVLREVGLMKDRIENEVVKSDEIERNVKLGRGGIREIEFVAQSLQLLHAGRQPFLQGSQTLGALVKLAQYELIEPAQARHLQEAYYFLRALEHRLQMDQNRQTHTVPEGSRNRQRLARLMECSSRSEFEQTWAEHRRQVRAIFEHLLRTEAPQDKAQGNVPNQFEGGTEAQWKTLLQQHSFKDLDRAFRVLREFVEGPGYVHVSPRTRELALKLIPRLFGLCPREGTARAQKPGTGANQNWPGGARSIPLSDADRVVTRLDSFITAYGARATLFELWNSNPAIFDLLLLLFDRSEFLAELAIRTPDLVDELVTSGRLRQRKSAEETLRDLRHGIHDADQHVWLRRYHQAELMRIGLRDILGLADFEQYLIELSALADACLTYALESVMERHRMKTPPFALIGLGKLGGAEIDYGSDLDILFVADSSARDLPKLSRVALAIMDLLSKRTEQGLVFITDARLRPDGEKGLLVNTLKAYEEYYRHRAQLWEIQSLTRVRFIAGATSVGEQFQRLAATLTNFKTPSVPLAAFTPDWKPKIHRMRMRIEKERTPRGKDELAIKTGMGGLMDAEFVAQTLCLEHGWQEPNTLRALERGREQDALPDADLLIRNYRLLRRVEGILRRWSYEGETVLPEDPAPFYRVSVRCGFETPEAFRQAIANWRRSIREVYAQVFSASEIRRVPPKKTGQRGVRRA